MKYFVQCWCSSVGWDTWLWSLRLGLQIPPVYPGRCVRSGGILLLIGVACPGVCVSLCNSTISLRDQKEGLLDHIWAYLESPGIGLHRSGGTNVMAHNFNFSSVLFNGIYFFSFQQRIFNSRSEGMALLPTSSASIADCWIGSLTMQSRDGHETAK